MRTIDHVSHKYILYMSSSVCLHLRDDDQAIQRDQSQEHPRSHRLQGRGGVSSQELAASDPHVSIRSVLVSILQAVFKYRMTPPGLNIVTWIATDRRTVTTQVTKMKQSLNA